MNKKILPFTMILALSMAVVGVAPANVNAQNPVPVISSISPSSVVAGSSAITLTVDGLGFMSTSVVYFDGVPRTTFFESSSRLTATIPATNLSTAGNFGVSVLNPTPGGGFSNVVTFTVTPAGNPVPSISAISPSVKTAGEPSFTLTVDGNNFISNSVVRFDGSPKATTFISSTRVTAMILASDISSVGTYNITVVNPTPQGGTSNQVTLTVNSATPSPVITSIAPNNVVAGGSSFTLTVNGFNFVATNTPSVVRINGVDRPTTIVSANQLTVSIPASDIASSGVINVTVHNAGPNNQGTSNTVVLNVNPAGIPLIASISPSSRIVGSSGFVLTVNGLNFVQGSTVTFNGIQRATVFASPTTLTATILASDITNVGNHSVRVMNPDGSGSNVILFSVSAVPALPDTGIGPDNGFGAIGASNAFKFAVGIAALIIAFTMMVIARKRA